MRVARVSASVRRGHAAVNTRPGAANLALADGNGVVYRKWRPVVLNGQMAAGSGRWPTLPRGCVWLCEC